MPPQSTHERTSAGTSCPTCGAPAERGQLVCLECGGRVALGYRRPPRWQVPAAVVTAVVLIAAGGLALALHHVSSNAKKTVASRPAPKTTAKKGAKAGPAGAGAKSKPATKTTTEKSRTATEQSKTTTQQITTTTPSASTYGDDAAPMRGGIGVWPARRDAFTVVLISSGDRASATKVAKEARRAKVPAGVLRSDDYSSLQQGFYIVFAGVYRTRAQAERAAGRFGRRYPGAFAQFVNGAHR